ncbi:MAG: tyrosine-type recombinase/integrase [Pseudomonadota bacterium]|nr:tyrosine-type recombinase/integrase [Pseudomonadota bacterium]
MELAMGEGKLLNQKECVALKPRDKDYTRGVKSCPRLSLRVRSNGTKEWRYKYTHPTTKVKSTPTIATFEECDFATAVDIAGQLADLLKKGITPDSAIKTKLIQIGDKAPETFSKLAELWVEHKLAGGKEFSDSTIDYWWRNIRYLNYYFGDAPPQSVSTRMILTACEDKQVSNGKKVGIDMRSYCESILRFGKIRGWLDSNEAIDTRGELLSAGAPRNHPALLDKLEIGRLLHSIDCLKETRTHPNTIRVLSLLPHLFVRSADIRSMRWEDIDLEAKRWVFSPQKGRSNERMVDSLVVPLSAYVLSELEDQKTITGDCEYVFASKGNTKNEFISRNVLNSAIERVGFGGEQSPHGFRATAKTLAMELPELNFSDTVTELQLGHKIKDIHGTAYNRVKFLDDRTRLMEEFSAWLLNAKEEYKKTIR